MLAELRRILPARGVSETVKGRSPCYTSEGGNIVLLGRMKDHWLLSFVESALQGDPGGHLQSARETSRSARVVR